MRFIDEVKIFVKAGDGGAGRVSWRKEAHVPKGGPDGGDGGDGGAVIFITDPNLNTLIDLSMSPHIRAHDGETGSDNNKTGAAGESKYIYIPAGTQVFYQDKLVADLAEPNCRWIAARGGKGGRGNTYFKSSKNRAPSNAQAGIPGENREFKLVLKSIADVGLVGYPNVGKSTLLRSVSRAHAKVADYPFTTLSPNLGVVTIKDNQKFVMADVPGLIEGASTGKGLGLEFLKHLERTKALVLIVDIYTKSDGHKLEDTEIDDTEIAKLFKNQFDLMLTELASFSKELASKLKLIVISKIDLPLNARAFELANSELEGIKIIGVSSHNQIGLDEFKEKVFAELNTNNLNQLDISA